VQKKYTPRIISIYLVFIALFLIIAARITYLQVFQHRFYKDLATNQYYRLLPLEGGRGDIFDRRGRILATGMNCYSIFADPKIVKDKDKTARLIAQELDLSEEKLLKSLSKKKRFVWVKRKVSWEEKERIRELDLGGVGFFREEKRFYPQEKLAASLLGIVGIDNRGLEGLELNYDDYLSGKDGLVRVLQDSSSKKIMLSQHIVAPQKGADVKLTIDAQIQYWSEKAIKETVENFRAKQASVIVMDALNGEILALANYPGFNPNKISSLASQDMRNRAIADMFEPGSVFKVVTLLASISENAFSDSDTVYCENGKYKIPGSTLHDWKPYGNLTFREVFKKSSNIGVAKLVESLGSQAYFKYIKRLEFGKVTGIDLPAESKGSIKPLKRWSRTSQYIIPIGQEIAVNLLQLAKTFAAIANDGYLVQPFVVKSVCSRNFCRQLKPKKRKVFDEKITARAKDILIEVVSDGTGRRAAVEGIKIGGKTGTAQKYDPKLGRYSPSKYRATFVGFVAESNPPLVIGVTVDEPKKSHFGGVVAAPVFKSIARQVVPYISSNELN